LENEEQSRDLDLDQALDEGQFHDRSRPRFRCVQISSRLFDGEGKHVSFVRLEFILQPLHLFL
jgi:hypothetical protein